MKSKLKKQKRAKNKLTKECMITLAIYVAAVLILPLAVFFVLTIGIPKDIAETLATVTICIWLLVILGGAAAVIFFALPHLRKRQALRDMKEYDFSPCDIGEEERFYCEFAKNEYVFKENVFDTDGEASFECLDDASAYLGQFGYDNLIYFRDLAEISEKPPYDLAGENLKARAVCKTRNGRTVITLYYQSELILKADGSVTINGGCYSNATAIIYAAFKGINAMVRIMFFNDDEQIADMKFSARAALALREYKIPIQNPELCGFILNAPEEAFKEMARRAYKML